LTDFLIGQLVRVSVHVLTASAANTMITWASMESRLRWQTRPGLQLSGRNPRRGPQRLQLRLIIRRPEVLDLPRSVTRGPHHLHCGRARGGLHCPNIWHQATRQPPNGPRLVRNFSSRELQTRSSPQRTHRESAIVSQLRIESVRFSTTTPSLVSVVPLGSNQHLPPMDLR
jgi:hypothetical protein